MPCLGCCSRNRRKKTVSKDLVGFDVTADPCLCLGTSGIALQCLHGNLPSMPCLNRWRFFGLVQVPRDTISGAVCLASRQLTVMNESVPTACYALIARASSQLFEGLKEQSQEVDLIMHADPP